MLFNELDLNKLAKDVNETADMLLFMKLKFVRNAIADVTNCECLVYTAVEFSLIILFPL